MCLIKIDTQKIQKKEQSYTMLKVIIKNNKLLLVTNPSYMNHSPISAKQNQRE